MNINIQIETKNGAGFAHSIEIDDTLLELFPGIGDKAEFIGDELKGCIEAILYKASKDASRR